MMTAATLSESIRTGVVRSRPPAAFWVALGLALAFWPVWRWYVLRLDDGSDEPMGLAALATAGWFLWWQREGLGVDRLTIILATGGLFAYATAYPWLSPLPRAVVALGVIALAFRLPKAGPGICLLLLLSLPVIATAQFYLGWPLRTLTAIGSEILLRLAGLSDLTREGTVLWWRGTPVHVDAPCSGVRMLWTGLFMHAAFLALNRAGWRRACWLTPLVMGLIIAANVARATLLFFQESDAIPLPDWAHPGIGLVVFAGLLSLLAAIHRRSVPTIKLTPAPRATPAVLPWRIALLGVIAAAAAPWLAGAAHDGENTASESDALPAWPTSWDGCDLVPVELADHERAFAKNFPGDLAVFRTTEGRWSRRLIVRWITSPTRKLHSSADCLRAEGFELEREWEIRSDDERWATWTAYHPENGAAFRVRERLWTDADPATTWTDVSAWFWDASFRGKRGPWWAVTIIEPLRKLPPS